MKLIKRAQFPILLTVLALVLFWDLLWLPGDQLIAGNDLQHMFLQWWRFGLESLRQGELPLWNPYLFSGVPFLANPQPALFYPPVWLLLVLPAAQVAGLLEHRPEPLVVPAVCVGDAALLVAEPEPFRQGPAGAALLEQVVALIAEDRADGGGPEQVALALGFTRHPRSIHRTRLILKN